MNTNKTHLIDEDWVFTASPNISFRTPTRSTI